ncbi:MAG: hypothetical protein CO093_07125, partial [Alphaproteobacteria bacterium CG_4_9_14_3_um_filter_47_13]
MNQRFFITAAIFSVTMAFASPSYAGCPCSVGGVRDYNTTNARYEFCDGTNWISIAGTGTLGACATAANFEYDTPAVNYKFCNSADWIPVANAGILGACASAKAIEYDTTLNTYRTLCKSLFSRHPGEGRG